MMKFEACTKAFPHSCLSPVGDTTKRSKNFFIAGLNPSFILSLYANQSLEETNWQQSCLPIQCNQAQQEEWFLDEEEWILDPMAFGPEENLFQAMDSNNLYETVFLTGPHQPPQQSKDALNNTQFLPKENLKKNRVPVLMAQKAPSKQYSHSNMAQQPFCYPYRDKIVVTDKRIIQDTHCISNTSCSTSVPHTSIYDSTTTPINNNYTSPSYSSIPTTTAPTYIDTSCTPQQSSSPVAQVPSISGSTSFFDQGDYYYNSSNSFEPIYYTSDVSLCPDSYLPQDTSEKSVDDWVQYLHSDDEGTSLEEPLGLGCSDNTASLFPDFAEEDLTMLDTILAEEIFPEAAADLPYHPQQQDMPAGSSASPQYQYLPEQQQPTQQQQPQVIQYVTIAPKPADYRPSQSLSPTSSTSSTSTSTQQQGSRKRQRIEFNNAEEEYRIKRNLNNLASAKSRAKKREQQEFMKQERVRLESRNRQLKNEVEEFERQIATLKDILYSKIKK